MLYWIWLASLASPMSPTETQLCPTVLIGTSIQLLHLLHQAVGVDVVIERPHLHVAGRQNQVALVERVDHVHQAQLPRQQLVGIHVDHDLPVLAAKRRRNLGAFHHRDLVANGELADVVKLRLRSALRP